MNDLEKYFFNVSEKPISKWRHYLKIYDRYFSSLRNRPITMLEIGVQQGGSIRMWRDYFHKDSTIVGIDIDPKCKDHATDSINIHIGSQNDETFINEIITRYDKFDIILDDGSHDNDHQVNTFKWMFPSISDGGVYMIEDIHTSYWPAHKGGPRMPGTCIEFSKNLIDDLNMYMSQWEPNYYSNNIGSLHFHDGIIIIEKQKREFAPYDLVCHNGSIVHVPEKVRISK